MKFQGQFGGDLQYKLKGEKPKKSYEGHQSVNQGTITDRAYPNCIM